MQTFHIHIKGRVQGVGFRPLVYRLAKESGILGTVNNTHDGVHIFINGDEKSSREFLNRILENAPPLSLITESITRTADARQFDDFQIIHSEEDGKRDLMITPDVALCKDCAKELIDPHNRRYHYPFITCTQCGPRFSIMKTLPYDRFKTTMDSFTMCVPCDNEFNDPMNRRHFSQTNSCPYCRVSLYCYTGHDPEDLRLSDNEIIQRILSDWSKGRIVAIKGIGGYLLTCDATKEKAVWNLRTRKLRPKKPFALMYPDLSSLRNDAWVSKAAGDQLLDRSAPIVLLPLHHKPKSGIVTELINPGLDKIGVMLPYTPLFKMLMDAYHRPVVATSGNLSGSPIIYHDDTALRELSRIADTVVTNDREIMVPQDDSVVSMTDATQRRIILRRSRGLAPSHYQKGMEWPLTRVLAMGADLKSAFTILHEKNTYISQYLGDLESFLSQLSMEATLLHFFDLLEFKPEVVLTDSHPNYFSTEFGEKLAVKRNIPVYKVQHHLAHFSSVLAENSLLETPDKILGIIWDGVGYGEDGCIWGGEFFTFRDNEFKRVFHLPYFDYLLGDKMSKEPRLSALSLLKEKENSSMLICTLFSEQEWSWYNKVLNEKEHIRTSSVGRLFDGIAAMVLGIDKMDYQGEAAMKLEQEARHYFYKHSPEHRLTYMHGSPDHFTDQLLDGMIRDIQKGKPVEYLAARFHVSLVDLILHVARISGAAGLAFSGGVFQNALLVELIEVLAGDKYPLYFQKELSPNDESISFGQLVYYQIQTSKNKVTDREEVHQ